MTPAANAAVAMAKESCAGMVNSGAPCGDVLRAILDVATDTNEVTIRTQAAVTTMHLKLFGDQPGEAENKHGRLPAVEELVEKHDVAITSLGKRMAYVMGGFTVLLALIEAGHLLHK